MSAFGTRLKELRFRTKDPKPTTRTYLTQARLAELMDIGISGKLVGHWESGEREIKHTDRWTLQTLIQVLHHNEGIQSLQEANEFLQLGLYSPLSEDEIRVINLQWLVEHHRNESRSNDSSHRIFSWQSAYDWLDSIFLWSQADAHARTSWAGMFIWSLSSFTKQLTPHSLLTIIGVIFMWVVAAWCLVPILQWPLATSRERQQAILLFITAWFSLPLLLTLFAEADNSTIPEEVEKPKTILFMLKFTGALVGCNMMVLLLIFVAIGWYYLTLPSMLWGWRFAVLLPLLMGHIGARRIPADRLNMYDGTLQVHSADKVFLGAYLLAGPLVGIFILWWYPFLANPAVGTSLLLVGIGIALWERQKQRPLREWLLIILLGFLIPLAIFSLFMFLFPTEETRVTLNSVGDTIIVTLALAYFLSFFTLWITLQLRNPPILTIAGITSLMVVLILLLLALLFYPLIGGIITIAVVIVWFVWGKSRFRHYLWIHQTAVWLIVTIGISIYLYTRNIIPTWLNLVVFLVIGMGIIVRAYQSKSLVSSENNA